LFEKVLLAYDGSEPSKKALEYTAELAKRLGSEVLVLHVIDIEKLAELLGDFDVPDLESLEKKARELVEEAAKYLEEKGVKARPLLKKGGPPETIAETAEEEGCSMIIVGSHGWRGFKRLFIGSVSEKVVRISKVPVLVVKYKWCKKRCEECRGEKCKER